MSELKIENEADFVEAMRQAVTDPPPTYADIIKYGDADFNAPARWLPRTRVLGPAGVYVQSTLWWPQQMMLPSCHPSLWFLAHARGRALRDLNPCEPPAKLLNHLDKLVVGDRFSEVGVTPEGITLLDLVPVICRGENNHRDMFGACIALQAS